MDAVDFRKLTSKYRTEIMGMAILMVIFHHIGFGGMYSCTGIANFFLKLGSCGVDLFLVLSSFGLYFSIEKNPNLWHFYKRRLFRITPAFLLIILGFHMNHLEDALNMRFWYVELRNNWYIPFILVAYLFFPLVYKLQKKRLLTPLLLACVISFIGTVLLVYSHRDNIHNVPMLMLQRLPVFCLGALLADSRAAWRLKHYSVCLLVLLFALYVSFALDKEYLVYPLYFLACVPMICLLVSCLYKLGAERLWGGDFCTFWAVCR